LARWKYWDALALAAGATPIFLGLFASLTGLHHGGMMIFAGSAGTLFWLASLMCLGLFTVSAIAGWRSGDRRLILGGGVLLALCAAPLLLLAACFSGNCL